MEPRRRSAYIAFQAAAQRVLAANSAPVPRASRRFLSVSTVRRDSWMDRGLDFSATSTMTEQLNAVLLGLQSASKYGSPLSSGLRQRPEPLPYEIGSPFQPPPPPLTSALAGFPATEKIPDEPLATSVSHQTKPTERRAVPILGSKKHIIGQRLAKGDLAGATALLNQLITHFRKITTLLPPAPGQKAHITQQQPLPSARDFTQWAITVRDTFRRQPHFDGSANLSYSMTSSAAPYPNVLKTSSSPMISESHLPGIDPSSMPASVLCAFTMAALFDACLAMRYTPEEDMIAVLLSCMSRAVSSAQEYDEFVSLALRSLQPHHYSEQNSSKESLPLGPLSAAIAGFGRLGSADSAEFLLANSVYRYVRESGVTPIYHEDIAFPLSGWSHDVNIWSSLVRARILDQDLAGAKEWFRLYRKILVPSAAEHCSASLNSGIYLTMMSGIVDATSQRMLSPPTVSRITESQERQVRGILRLMHADGVKPSVQLLNFLITFERRLGRSHDRIRRHRDGAGSVRRRSDPSTSEPATKVAQFLLDRATRRQDWDSHAFRQAFDVLSLPSESHSPPSASKRESRTASVASLRRLLADLLQREGKCARGRRGRSALATKNKASLLHPATLRSAFLAALKQGDWPCALLVLDLSLEKSRDQAAQWSWCRNVRGTANEADSSESHWLTATIEGASTSRLPSYPKSIAAARNSGNVVSEGREMLQHSIIQEVRLSLQIPSASRATESSWIRTICAEVSEPVTDSDIVRRALISARRDCSIE